MQLERVDTDAGHTLRAGATNDGPQPVFAWARLVVALLLSTLGGVGMWSVVVALPAVQAGIRRCPRRSFAPLYAHHDLFRPGRHAHGPSIRPLRCGPGGGHRSGLSRAGLRRREPDREPVAVRPGCRASSSGSAARQRSPRCWPMRPIGSRAGGASRWPSSPAAITCPERSGHRCSSTSSQPRGWRATYLGVGGFCLVTMLPIALRLRGRPPSVPIFAGRSPRRRALGCHRALCRFC